MKLKKPNEWSQRMVRRTAKETLSAFLGVQNPIGMKMRIVYNRQRKTVTLIRARWVSCEGQRIQYTFMEGSEYLVTMAGAHIKILGVYVNNVR